MIRCNVFLFIHKLYLMNCNQIVSILIGPLQNLLFWCGPAIERHWFPWQPMSFPKLYLTDFFTTFLSRPLTSCEHSTWKDRGFVFSLISFYRKCDPYKSGDRQKQTQEAAVFLYSARWMYWIGGRRAYKSWGCVQKTVRNRAMFVEGLFEKDCGKNCGEPGNHMLRKTKGFNHPIHNENRMRYLGCSSGNKWKGINAKVKHSDCCTCPFPSLALAAPLGAP